MNILLLTEDYHPNIDGGALVRSRFTELVDESPHELTVITGRPEGTSFIDEHHNAKVIRPLNPAPEDIQGYEFGGFVYRILFSISLFFVGCYVMLTDDIEGIYSKSYSTHWAGKVLSLVFKRPLLTFIGGTPSLGTYRSSRLKLLPEWINMRFFMGDFVYTRTPQTSERVSRISGKPTEVLHGVLNKRHIREAVTDCSPDQIRSKYDVNESGYLIVFIGRLVPLKNPEKAIEIVTDLPADYSMVLIGGGPEYESLQRQIEAIGVGDRVHLTGQLSHQETLKIAYAADAQVVTSKIEAYPSVVFEGLALNNDVFTNDVGVVSTLTEESLHVTDNIATEIRSKTIQKKFKINEYVLKKYSIERYTQESLRTMNDLVSIV